MGKMKVEKKPGDPENVVTLTAQELQSRLWEAANILRGSAVDRMLFITLIRNPPR